MNKKQLLQNQARELRLRFKKLEAMEQQKVGKLVISWYEKNLLADGKLHAEVGKIIGNDKVEIKPKASVENQLQLKVD